MLLLNQDRSPDAAGAGVGEGGVAVGDGGKGVAVSVGGIGVAVGGFWFGVAEGGESVGLLATVVAVGNPAGTGVDRQAPSARSTNTRHPGAREERAITRFTP